MYEGWPRIQIAQAGLQLTMIPLLQPPKLWDYRHSPSNLVATEVLYLNVETIIYGIKCHGIIHTGMPP